MDLHSYSSDAVMIQDYAQQMTTIITPANATDPNGSCTVGIAHVTAHGSGCTTLAAARLCGELHNTRSWSASMQSCKVMIEAEKEVASPALWLSQLASSAAVEEFHP